MKDMRSWRGEAGKGESTEKWSGRRTEVGEMTKEEGKEEEDMSDDIVAQTKGKTCGRAFSVA